MTALHASFAPTDEASQRSLFCTSSRVTVLDHLRVPYELDAKLAGHLFEELRPTGGGPGLLWAREVDGRVVATTILGADRMTPIPLFTRVVNDEVTESLLREHGGTWSRAREVISLGGKRIGSIWREDGGSVFLPFDPNEVVESFWSEHYLEAVRRAGMQSLRRRMMAAYYRTRPFLPRGVQIGLRRQFARVQARSRFPRWPVEPCLHDFFELMIAILAGIAGEPIPCIAPWPDGNAWAFVLTHDVEQAEGLAAVGPVAELERAHGLRSSWNLVPKRYEIDASWIAFLSESGFEIGVHGLFHDGRDLESWSTWQRRLPAAHASASAWKAVGFRSAALHRDPGWMRALSFDYDSSWPDTDPFEPQNGGCCTWLPFFNGNLVELPLTLPQDHTLFVILGQGDETTWVQKAEFLRARGGMVSIDTHPDYLTDERIFGAYARFLDRFADDPTAWRALPREVSAWWRRRAASWLEHDGATWRIVGPAAEQGRVVLEERAW